MFVNLVNFATFIFANEVLYLIGQNNVGQKWRNFLEVTKIMSDEKFCPTKNTSDEIFCPTKNFVQIENFPKCLWTYAMHKKRKNITPSENYLWKFSRGLILVRTRISLQTKIILFAIKINETVFRIITFI